MKLLRMMSFLSRTQTNRTRNYDKFTTLGAFEDMSNLEILSICGLQFKLTGVRTSLQAILIFSHGFSFHNAPPLRFQHTDWAVAGHVTGGKG